jgi:hypothetical protein
MDDLTDVLPALGEIGYVPIASQYSPLSFGGDYFVDFTGPRGHSFRLIYDRSQYIVDGQRSELEAAGLWRAFDDRAEFTTTLLDWLQSRKAK